MIDSTTVLRFYPSRSDTFNRRALLLALMYVAQVCEIMFLTPSTFSLMSRPAALNKARRIDVAVPVCLDATR